MKRWAAELALLGVTLVFVAGAFAGYFYAGLASHIDALPVPGVSTGDTIKVPASPGTLKALDVCQKGLVTKGQTHIEGSNTPFADSYQAVFGASVLKWVNNPDFKKTPPGNQTMILDGQPIVTDKGVQECMVSRAK